MNGTGSPGSKLRYNRRLVDFVLSMERALVTWGISDLVYRIVAGPLAAIVYCIFFLKQKQKVLTS